MASADQLKALLQSYIDGDDARFYSVAMQVAAHEAKRGHGRVAEDLRALIDQAKAKRGAGATVNIAKPRGELANLLSVVYPKARLADMTLSAELQTQLERVIREQRHAATIVPVQLGSARL